MIPPIGKCEHGIKMDKDCSYCERYLVGVDNIDAVGESTIEGIQKQRGSVYGKFEEQCECVGKIIDALANCSINNGVSPTYKQLGAFAYMAIKQARYAVSPQHEDTLIDLESYCNLIKKMEVGDE